MKNKIKAIGSKLWKILCAFFGILWGINVGIFIYQLTPERFRTILVLVTVVLYLRYEIRKRTIYVNRQVNVTKFAPNQAQALYTAVAAIYFADSRDYRGALWNVVRHLSPMMADELISNERIAYEKAYEFAHDTKPE